MTNRMSLIICLSDISRQNVKSGHKTWWLFDRSILIAIQAPLRSGNSVQVLKWAL